MYQDRDWPMVRQFQSQLQLNPQLGLVLLDNVRCDSAGRSHEIRSAFIESFVTTEEISLASPGAGDPIHVLNRFVFILNTNDGNLSTGHAQSRTWHPSGAERLGLGPTISDR